MHALYCALKCRKLVIMRCKHRLCAELALVGAVFEHGSCYRHAVICGGAAAYLVQDEQARARCIAQDVCDLAHFEHEGRLTGGKIVRCADSRENTVDNADDGAFCRNERAYLRHEHDECRLPHVGRFTGHIGAGYDGDTVGVAV